MKVELLRELWAQDLKQLFTAEAGVKEALRRILEASSLGELQSAISEHLERSKLQIARLERIFQGLDFESTAPRRTSGEPPSRKAGRSFAAAADTISEPRVSVGDRTSAAAHSGDRGVDRGVGAYGTARGYASFLGGRQTPPYGESPENSETLASAGQRAQGNRR